MESDRAGAAREPFLDVEATVSTPGAEDASAEASLGEESAPAADALPPPVSVLKLFRFATKAERAMLVVAAACAVAQGASMPLQSFFMKDLFMGIFYPNDNGTLPPMKGPHSQRDEKVLQSFLTFLALAGGTFCVALVSQLVFSRIGDRISMRVKTAFFDQLLQKDVGWYDLHSSAEMATRLTNDTYDLRQGIGEKLATMFSALMMSPCGFAVAFIQDWRLTLMMLAAIPLMAITMSVTIRFMSKSAGRKQEFYAQAGGVAETALSSMRTVASFTGYSREIAKYDKLLAAAERDGTRAGLISGISMGFTQLVMFSMFALGFYIGSYLVINDYNDDCWKKNPPFGDCFTGATMLSTLFAVLYGGIGLAQASPGFASLSAAKAAAGRIYAVLDEPPAFDADAGEILQKMEGNIELLNVSFSYPSRPDYIALKDVSIKIPKGKTVAFVGPSGSGKSTIIALLQRFYDPQSGAVMLDGRDIRTINLNSLRSHMALVQQEPVLFTGTILQNIAYGLGNADLSSQDAVQQAAKSANAHDFIMEFPANYETECGERGVQLSGGQKQRIAIARAMIRDPKVLLLDEATSALDNESERVVQRALDKLLAQKARTTVAIAHRLSTIQDADVIIVFENGKLLESGTHDELVKLPGSLYGQLVALQAITGDADVATLVRTISNASVDSPKQLGQAARQLSTRTAGSSPQRQVSRPAGFFPSDQQDSAADVDKSGEETDAVAEIPAEDNVDIPVPTSRLFALQGKHTGLVVIALLATVPVSVCRPLMGFLFSETSNLYSQPPAKLDFSQRPPRWVGALDVDKLRQSANTECLSFVILGAIMMISTIGQIGGFRKSSEALTRQLRYLTFTAMLRQEMAWFDARTSGHLADRLASEAPLIKAFTGESLAGVMQMLLTVLTGLGIAFWYSWELTLASFIFLPLMMLGVGGRMKQMMQVNETKAGPMVSEAVSNIRSVASFSLRTQMMARYKALMGTEGAVELRKSTSTAIGSAYTSAVVFIMFGAVIYVANLFINQSWIEPTSVMRVLFPIMFCVGGAAQASNWRADKAKAQAAVNHIFHTLDRTPAIDAYDTGGQVLGEVRGEIEFRHVAFNYPTRPDIPVFVDFDLIIHSGNTVAFVGPSGSGKSTTISLLQRFYEPASGSVHLDGHDIRELNITWLRAQMAFVQQEPILFGGTILDNIAYGILDDVARDMDENAIKKQCQKAAESANAHNFISEFPNGYATEVGERGAQLSGGQKQRIAIARSMVRNPSVILLDEATSALDTESERIVQEALDRLLAESNRTTLVVAHRLSTIVNSDVICYIYQGKIVEKGSHNELMKIPDGHYKQLALRQTDTPK